MMTNLHDDYIKITVSSPEDIIRRSYGEVTKAETLNYRTLIPEKDGLFCCRIFGPVNDYECQCGKYKKQKYDGIICEKCGVEVTSSLVRRRRMGHIKLAFPVVHPLFFLPKPPLISHFLKIAPHILESIIYFESDVVIDPGSSRFKKWQIVSQEQSRIASIEHSNLVLESGAQAILSILEQIDVPEMLADLLVQLNKTDSNAKKVKLNKSIDIIEKFIASGNKLSSLILTHLAVVPPSIRPLVSIEHTRFASSDLNELYRRIINRNNRLKKLYNLNAPSIILRSEKRMVQDAVTALFDSTKINRNVLSNKKQVFKSLSEYLKGKPGIFRQNIMGKRVDYSARSAITVGPNYKINECGLPYQIAVELFRPFLYRELLKQRLANNLRAAKAVIDSESSVVYNLLKQLTYNHPVILNRAPTLHKVSMQAFYPRITKSKAIELHPLACVGFNADFDGDSMAVHLPISEEAKAEARTLMMSSNNFLSPATGKPLVGMSQDMVLGLYWVTNIRGTASDKVYSTNEVINLLNIGKLKLNTAVRCLIEGKERIISPGIASLYENFKGCLSIDMLCQPATKRHLLNITHHIISTQSETNICKMLNDLMWNGFVFAAKSGISIRLSDMIVLDNKDKLLQHKEQESDDLYNQYKDGLLTKEELDVNLIKLWSDFTDELSDLTLKKIDEHDRSKPNHINIMFKSGARGSKTQIRQMVGMRGLMSKPDGSIMTQPVTSNFVEGIDCLSYFNTTHGSRKGLSDTALKTANSGYMFRKLADTARDIVISGDYCGTDEYITVYPISEGKNIICPLSSQISGRFIAQDLKNKDGQLLARKDQLLDNKTALLIDEHNIGSVDIYSPITCIDKNGCCKRCYGKDLATDNIAVFGDPIGIIAAQSIGEPGTQMTMRTFHKGGVSQYSGSISYITVSSDGIVQFDSVMSVVNSNGDLINLKHEGEIKILSDGNVIESHRMGIGAIIYVTNQQHVTSGTVICYDDKSTNFIIATKSGTCSYHQLDPSINLRVDENKSTGITDLFITSSDLKPQISIKQSKDRIITSIPAGARLYVRDGQHVEPGDCIATVSLYDTKTSDIVISGLPHITHLFEQPQIKHPATLSKTDGIVSLSSSPLRNVITVTSNDGVATKYSLRVDVQIICFEGQKVSRGEPLSSGAIDLRQLVQIIGRTKVGAQLCSTLQNAYLTQGIQVNNKHFEIIVAQMLSLVKVTYSEDSKFIVGNVYKLKDIRSSDAKIEYTAQIQGIKSIIANSDSFLNSCSFQDTTRRLSYHALIGSKDHLKGSKENLVLGRLCPVGTGLYDQSKIIQQMLPRRIYSVKLTDLLKTKDES